MPTRWQAKGTGPWFERVTSTEWHPQFRLPTHIASPKLLTSYEYDSQGNLHKLTEQATSDENGSKKFAATLIGNPRSWTYTYNAQGQIKTITGPRSDVLDLTSYEYDAQGNLSRVTNSAGHITQLLRQRIKYYSKAWPMAMLMRRMAN